MKFDALVYKLLSETTPERKTYIVKLYGSHGLKDQETTAGSKKQAITQVVSRQLQDRFIKQRLSKEQIKRQIGIIISDIIKNDRARAREKTYTPPSPPKPNIVAPEVEREKQLEFQLNSKNPFNA